MMQHEAIKTAVLEMWAHETPRPGSREIARRLGLKSCTSVLRIIREEVHTRHAEKRDLIVEDMDTLAESQRAAAQKILDDHEATGAHVPAPLLASVASTLTSLSRYWGLGADASVDVNVNGEVTHTVADDLVARVKFAMLGLDAINLDGVGSGRTPEEQVAALEAAGPIIDAVVVEDEDDDDYSYEDDGASYDTDTEVPGRWIGGKRIPWWNDNAWHWPAVDDDPDIDPDPTFYNGHVL